MLNSGLFKYRQSIDWGPNSQRSIAKLWVSFGSTQHVAALLHVPVSTWMAVPTYVADFWILAALMIVAATMYVMSQCKCLPQLMWMPCTYMTAPM